ncbi:hypothetical protein O181_055885 [Austropuccinia psidii MF-1]|uniref:Uncharacterized protein n=1 Tax=Austropuccinia psidii MF-1 TaxID=1389203 RepID=A0A9Q3EBN8_9BASI|nr:hypothetical protein [Austropuccinia psidii MF-1]
MSNRWKERKGAFVSSTELQARRKALLAPVQRFRRAWVQISPDSTYKVLKWVPHDTPIGLPINKISNRPGQSSIVDSFYDDLNTIESLTDDEDLHHDHDGDGDSSEDDPNQTLHLSLNDLDSTNPIKTARELKLNRKTTKVIQDTERVGGQLAGLETGEITQQIDLDDEDDENLRDQSNLQLENPTSNPLTILDQSNHNILPSNQVLDVDVTMNSINSFHHLHHHHLDHHHPDQFNSLVPQPLNQLDSSLQNNHLTNSTDNLSYQVPNLISNQQTPNSSQAPILSS